MSTELLYQSYFPFPVSPCLFLPVFCIEAGINDVFQHSLFSKNSQKNMGKWEGGTLDPPGGGAFWKPKWYSSFLIFYFTYEQKKHQKGLILPVEHRLVNTIKASK